MKGIKHKAIFPLLAMLIGLTAGLFLVELLLRVSGKAPVSKVHSVTSHEFKRIPGILRSNQDLVSTKNTALPHRITINSIGYRGEEFPVEKPDGEVRVLMIGDSFTFGDNVENTKTLPAQLEKQLRAKCRSKSIRVINGGVNGSTVIFQTEMIKRGLVLKPDLVVLVFFENDIRDLRSPLWPRIAYNRELKDRFPINLLWRVLRSTATWIFGLDVQRRWQKMHRFKSSIVAGHTDDATWAEATSELRDLKARYRRALLGAYKLVRQHNIEFVFMIYPSYGPLKGGKPSMFASWAEQTGQSAGMRTLSLFVGMRKGLSEIDKGYLVPHDIHPSARGHEIAARSSAQFLLLQEPLRSACS